MGESLTDVDSALELLLALVRPTAHELVPLADGHGRVLAADVVGRWQLPGCDNSSMDGFAVRSTDCAGASAARPVILPLNGEARAGSPPADLEPGSAMAISTGAPLPLGADGVVRVEDTEDRDGAVAITVEVDPGSFIRRAGADTAAGTVMVPRGQRLRAVDIAACAAAGASTLTVHRRPRVALLVGGDELVPVGTPPSPHQVVDSNTPMLVAAVVEAGGEVQLGGVMADDREAVTAHLLEAATCDLVVSSAGVSVGTHDHVRAAVQSVGTVDLWRVAMRPGKPLLVGTIDGTPVIGLPGNPASGAVTFEVFGRPAVLALQGANTVRRRPIAVRLGEDLVTPRHLTTFVRVRLAPGADGIPVAHASGDQGSSMLRSLSGADALLRVDPGLGGLRAGAVATALELT